MKKSKKKNQIYVVLSTSIVLFFIGLYMLGLFHTGNIAKILKEQVSHVIELKDQSSGDQTTVLNTIRNVEGIIAESVQYIDKSEALNIMATEIDTSLIRNQQNPFLDVVTFRSEAEANITAVHEKVKALPIVASVYAQDLQFDQIKKNLSKVGLILLIAAGIFSILAMALIFSTLQLQLYSDRFEIKTMELVGAHDRFIKIPYLRRALMLGTRATINAALFLIILFVLMKYYWIQTNHGLNYTWLILTIIILWFLGVLFLWVSSNFLIQKFLSKRMNDLYN